MIGEVHDPRSFALGGVAGHAGLFSTAQDLSRFCRMLLHHGMLDGKRVLSGSTYASMVEPRALPDGTGCRGYGFGGNAAKLAGDPISGSAQCDDRTGKDGSVRLFEIVG